MSTTRLTFYCDSYLLDDKSTDKKLTEYAIYRVYASKNKSVKTLPFSLIKVQITYKVNHQKRTKTPISLKLIGYDLANNKIYNAVDYAHKLNNEIAFSWVNHPKFHDARDSALHVVMLNNFKIDSWTNYKFNNDKLANYKTIC